MPTTLIGLVIFVVLLMPGFAFVLRRERHSKAERRLSVFRETIAIAFASVIADGSVIGIFYLVKLWLPQSTPDINALVKGPAVYFQMNYWDIFAWSAGLLLLATVGAYVMASPKLDNFFTNPFLSAWSIVFHQHDKRDVEVYVGCTMTDGSYVGGYLFSYSRLSDDLPDRDIALTGDISYRPPEGDLMAVLDSVGGVVLSARNISMMTVSYIDRTSVASQEVESLESADGEALDSEEASATSG